MVRSEIELPANTSLDVIRKADPFQTSSLVRKNADGTTDKSECYQYIKIAILGIAQFFGSQFSDYQLSEVSKILYSKFFYWRLLDWKNFKERVCGLSYGKDNGKIFGFVNTGHIMEWANAYDQDWTLSVESESENEHDKLKKIGETERSLAIEVKEKLEEKIHQSAISEFKKRVEENVIA